MDDKITIEMSDYGVEDAYSIMQTFGCGPCVGVAFSYHGTGFMMHEFSNDINPEVLISLLTQARNLIPINDRNNIYPVVVGGRVDENEDVIDETSASREFVVSELINCGFATPKEFWAEKDCSKNLYLHVNDDYVKIETMCENENISAKEIIVDFNKNG